MSRLVAAIKAFLQTLLGRDSPENLETGATHFSNQGDTFKEMRQPFGDAAETVSRQSNTVINWNEPGDTEVLLRYYGFIRQEISDSFRGRDQILTFSVAALSATFFAAYTIAKDTIFVAGPDSRATLAPESIYAYASICYLFIPFLSSFFMAMYLGEVQRMIRAGRYLRYIESAIVRVLIIAKESRFFATLSSGEEAKSMLWENYVRTRTKKMRYTYLIGLAFYLGVSSCSLVSDFFIIPPDRRNGEVHGILLSIGFTVLAIQLIWASWLSSQIIKDDDIKSWV